MAAARRIVKARGFMRRIPMSARRRVVIDR
jgi:hypothetical protein